MACPYLQCEGYSGIYSCGVSEDFKNFLDENIVGEVCRRQLYDLCPNNPDRNRTSEELTKLIHISILTSSANLIELKVA